MVMSVERFIPHIRRKTISGGASEVLDGRYRLVEVIEGSTLTANEGKIRTLLVDGSLAIVNVPVKNLYLNSGQARITNNVEYLSERNTSVVNMKGNAGIAEVIGSILSIVGNIGHLKYAANAYVTSKGKIGHRSRGKGGGVITKLGGTVSIKPN